MQDKEYTQMAAADEAHVAIPRKAEEWQKQQAGYFVEVAMYACVLDMAMMELEAELKKEGKWKHETKRTIKLCAGHAERLHDFCYKVVIGPRSLFDIGANYGEYAYQLSKVIEGMTAKKGAQQWGGIIIAICGLIAKIGCKLYGVFSLPEHRWVRHIAQQLKRVGFEEETGLEEKVDAIERDVIIN